jgi:hypothetical protein
MGSRGGRPTKFDVEKGQRVCSALSEGLFLTDAAAIVGVDVRTVERWIEAGRRGREPYAGFAKDVDHARAQFVLLSLRKIREGADDTRGLRWLLERLRPRQYGDRVQVHIENHVNELLEQLEKVLPPDVYELVLAVASGEGGTATPPEAESRAAIH